jgi:hypothetical protein
MEQAAVLVPRGIFRKKGSWSRKATIRALTGLDEQLLAEVKRPPHLMTLTLLESIVELEGAPTRSLQELGIGDRAFLLLAARRLMLGDRMRCIINCPRCKNNMSVDFSISDLLDQNYPEPKESYDFRVCGFVVRLRPLTTTDQDALAVAREDRHAMVRMLARACIVQSQPTLPEELPDDLLEAVGEKLGEIDPLSDVMLTPSCPECGHRFHASLPVEEFVLRELVPGPQLEREVHWLAFHYHWTEKEILSLPAAKRKRYVELINATLAGEGT